MTRTTVAARLAAAGIVLAALAAAIGLFVPALYRDAPTWAAQARGADLATIVLALPLAGVAWLVGRHRPMLGRSLTGGVLLYLLYTYLLVAFSVAHDELTLACIAIVGSVVWALLLAVPSVLAEPAETPAV